MARDTVIFVYFELKGKPLVWKRAWIKSTTFDIIAKEIEEEIIQVGKEIKTGTNITIKKSDSSSSLYLLQLIPSTDHKLKKNFTDNYLHIEGLQGRNVFFFSVKNLKEISSPAYM